MPTEDRRPPVSTDHVATAPDPAAARGARRHPELKRSVGATALAVAVLGIGSNLGGLRAPELRTRLIVIGLAVLFIVLGVVATRSSATQVARAAGRASVAAESATNLLCRLVGYLVVAVGTLGILTIPLQQLLIGGALTGVVIGIAAQQPLSNLFAGLVLLFARPITGRQWVRIHSGALGGPLEGSVVELGLIFTTLDTGGETLHIPNSALLGSAMSTRPADRSPTPAQPDQQPCR